MIVCTLIRLIFLCTTLVSLATPSLHLETLLIQWPVVAPPSSLNPTVKQALWTIEQNRHRVDEPSIIEEVEYLMPLSQHLITHLNTPILLQARFPLKANETTVLWIDQTVDDYHLYGSMRIEKNRYYNVQAHLLLEQGQQFWPIKLHKKSKSAQINYVESLPLGMIFYIA